MNLSGSTDFKGRGRGDTDRTTGTGPPLLAGRAASLASRIRYDPNSSTEAADICILRRHGPPLPGFASCYLVTPPGRAFRRTRGRISRGAAGSVTDLHILLRDDHVGPIRIGCDRRTSDHPAGQRVGSYAFNGHLTAGVSVMGLWLGSRTRRAASCRTGRSAPPEGHQ